MAEDERMLREDPEYVRWLDRLAEREDERFARAATWPSYGPQGRSADGRVEDFFPAGL